MSGVTSIFAEMRKVKMNAMNEEKSEIQEEKVKEVKIETPDSTETIKKVWKDKDEMDEALEINKKATNGRAFTVEINGKKYSYYPTEESGLTAKELGEKYSKIAKYSQGKALAWLKKNATTPQSYRKAKDASEEKIEEEMTVIIDAEDILSAADEISKARAEGKEVVVKQKADGFEIETKEVELEKPEDEDPNEECGTKKDEACKKDEAYSSDEEVCPVCGAKHKKDEKCCEEVDVAELAARLDECQGSDYMVKALEEGKYDLVKKYLAIKED